MKTVVRMKFGSHLYGTNTPASDLDYKGIYIPPAYDIITQKVKHNITTGRAKVPGERNTADDVDTELMSLAEFFKLLSQGQTVVLDMLFCPKEMMLETSAIWEEVVANKDRLLTRKALSFIGYCRTQANKYGIKGSRVRASKDASEFFEYLCNTAMPFDKLSGFASEIEAFAKSHPEHCSIVDQDQPNLSCGPRVLRHFMCCDKMIPYTNSIKSAHDLYKRIYDNYGHRARQAETNEGVDYKALSHAVRVAYEALELMQTGSITFPLPYKDHILKIKAGEVHCKEVFKEIEELLEKVEAAEGRSVLPPEVDWEWINDCIYRHYKKAVLDEYTTSPYS